MKYRKSGLTLTSGVFQCLYSELIEQFEARYNVKADTFMDYQLFGYGNYNTAKPNLKQYILDTTDIAVSGKYLYNKYLNWRKGISQIKFTREYTDIYFNALGYKNLNDFLDKVELSEEIKKEQESIDLKKKIRHIEEYYLGYYQNEEGEITKTKLTISKSTKKLKWTLIYLENGIHTEYVYLGEIRYQENGMSFVFDNTLNELDRSAFVGFSFDRSIKTVPYLIGSYLGFDRERIPVCGTILYERKNNWDELVKACATSEVDYRISDFILGNRYRNSSTLPQSLDDLSKVKVTESNAFRPTIKTTSKTPFHLSGTFQLWFSDKTSNQNPISLKMDKFGQVEYNHNGFQYSGNAFISEGSILSIHITHCNNVPHSAQLLAFVGKYSINQLAWTKGTWHGLDETLTPCTKEVIIINTPDEITQSELDQIQQSEKKLFLKS